MSHFRRAVGAGAGLAAAVALNGLSTVPITVHRGADGMVRVAWSAPPERIERCREQSAEELARLPAHMRQPVVCEGVSAGYELVVRIDGRDRAQQLLHGGGLRQDRRVYVFSEVPVPPGAAEIEVLFDRIDAGQPPSGTAGGVANERAAAALPPHLVFKEHTSVRGREVILITYEPRQRRLVAVRNP